MKEDSNKLWVQQTHAERLEFIKGLVEYGSQTLKALVLLNGGALVALLALSGNIFDKAAAASFATFQATFAQSSSYFTWGLTAAVAATAFAYVNFSFCAYDTYDPRELREWLNGKEPPRSGLLHPFVIITGLTSIALSIASLTLFLLGATLVKNGLLTLSK